MLLTNYFNPSFQCKKVKLIFWEFPTWKEAVYVINIRLSHFMQKTNFQHYFIINETSSFNLLVLKQMFFRIHAKFASGNYVRILSNYPVQKSLERLTKCQQMWKRGGDPEASFWWPKSMTGLWFNVTFLKLIRW